MRTRRWIEDIRRDAAYGARIIRRNPGFAVTAILSLAIGIGANTAVFTAANALLFRDPPGVVHAHRLADIGSARGDGGLNPTSYWNYLEVRRRTTTLSGVYAQQMFPHAVSIATSTGGATADRAFAHYVTINYFSVLGVVPFAGRLFDATDRETPGASPIVVVSHAFWSTHFGGDRAAIGTVVRVNGRPFTIVGVAPPGFQGTGVTAPDLWVPLTMAVESESLLARRGGGSVMIGGRLEPTVTLAQAAGEIDALGYALAREFPADSTERGLRLVPASRSPGNQMVLAGFAAVLMAIVGLVLAVACANVAGLLLARATSRQQEMAVRMAIGASRWRLLRQLIAETTILFTFGGIAGVVVARVLTALVLPLLPSLPFPVMVPLTVDVRVIAFTAIVSFAAALVFGLAPALQTARADLVTALKRDAHGSGTRSRLRGAFVVAQVAFSLLLIVVAGLFVRALAVAGSRQPGFDARGVQLVTFDLSMGGYTDATGPRFWRELRERVRQLPDVQSATLARVLPGGFEGIGLGGVSAPDAAPDPRGDFQYSWNIVDAGYFETLRIPLIAGRDFTDGDVHGAPPVVIVGQAAARRFWPNESAVGKTLYYNNGPRRTALRVVGVAGDVRSSSLVDGLAGSFIYLPLQQNYHSDMTGRMTIAVRSTHDAAIADSIRAVVASMDPRLAAVSSEALEDATALGRVPQRLVASFSGTLGAVGLLLAAIGVYGVTAYAAARRRRELGIRIALGATRGSIVSLMLRQGVWLTVVGCAIGLALAAGASQVLGVFLLGMPALHVPTFAGAGAIFLIVGVVACYLPARRATRVDPLECLRQE